MNGYPYQLWVLALALAGVIDYLFWGKTVGINFGIFTFIALVGGMLVLIASHKKPSGKSLWLIAPFAFFAVMTFTRREPLSLFLAYTFTTFSLGVLAITYLSGGWTKYDLTDYFTKLFQLIGSMVVPASVLSIPARKNQPEGEGSKKRAPLILQLWRGLLIVFPIIAAFSCLLLSSDVDFQETIGNLSRLINVERIIEYAFRFFIILFSTYLLAGVYLHAAVKSQDNKLANDDEQSIKPWMSIRTPAIILGSVSVLLLLFILVQFRYFFGGYLNIGPNGYTYSEYARRGFDEFLLIAFFCLILIFGLGSFTKRENKNQQRIFTGLSIGFAALVMVVFVSAYQRFGLAMSWHGLSRLRLYAIIFLVWAEVLVVALVFLEITQKKQYFMLAVVLASIGFAVSLNLFNIDALIVRENIARVSQGQYFNASYLTTLSTDAVPILVDEFTDESLSTPVHERIGAALVCYFQSHDIQNTSIDDWQSFNLSLWKARRALDGVKDQLADYHLRISRASLDPAKVYTPGKIVFVCLNIDQLIRDY